MKRMIKTVLFLCAPGAFLFFFLSPGRLPAAENNSSTGKIKNKNCTITARIGSGRVIERTSIITARFNLKGLIPVRGAQTSLNEGFGMAAETQTRTVYIDPLTDLEYEVISIAHSGAAESRDPNMPVTQFVSWGNETCPPAETAPLISSSNLIDELDTSQLQVLDNKKEKIKTRVFSEIKDENIEYAVGEKITVTYLEPGTGRRYKSISCQYTQGALYNGTQCLIEPSGGTVYITLENSGNTDPGPAGETAQTLLQRPPESLTTDIADDPDFKNEIAPAKK